MNSGIPIPVLNLDNDGKPQLGFELEGQQMPKFKQAEPQKFRQGDIILENGKIAVPMCYPIYNIPSEKIMWSTTDDTRKGYVKMGHVETLISQIGDFLEEKKYDELEEIILGYFE